MPPRAAIVEIHQMVSGEPRSGKPNITLDLAAHALAELVRRARVEPDVVEGVILACARVRSPTAVKGGAPSQLTLQKAFQSAVTGGGTGLAVRSGK